ncbi:MAG: acetyltransferase [Bacteroidota bacterium]
MKTLYILGCAPFGLNLLMEAAEEIHGIQDFKILKNIVTKVGKEFVPLPSWTYEFFEPDQLPDIFEENAQLAISPPNARPGKIVYDYFTNCYTIQKEQFPNFIHPKAYLSPSVTIYHALQIEPHASVMSCATLGFSVIIKRNAAIGHHVKLADFVTINPGAIINSNVKIGTGTTIGAGAVVRDHITIGKNSIIGAGSVVVKDIPDSVVAFGNPCKVYQSSK